MLTDLQSRVFVWVKYTGSHSSGDWYVCRNNERIRYLLNVLDIEYTIRKTKLYFSWLHDLHSWSWEINIVAAIDEIRVISCMNVRTSLKLNDNEQLIFITQAHTIGEDVKFDSTGTLKSIFKSLSI